MSAADGGDRSAVDAQVLRSFVLQTPADHDSELVLDSFSNGKMQNSLGKFCTKVLNYTEDNDIILFKGVFFRRARVYQLNTMSFCQSSFHFFYLKIILDLTDLVQ